MRIDFHYGPQTVSETDRSTARNSTTTANSAASKVPAEDDSQLLGAHAQVQALAAQASTLPEVREDRVQSLRLAIQNGHYQACPENIAGALLSHMALGVTGPNAA